MTILVTGARGQLAFELAQSCAKDKDVIFASRNELNIADEENVNQFFEKYKITAVINAAAYTAVDKAESELVEAASVNHIGVRYLTDACLRSNAFLLHISTDFVFDGKSNQPYGPEHLPNPQNAYGVTKLDGEREIQQSKLEQWCVVRTAWVYSAHGNNFVKTMLRLMSEKPALSIVADQIGSPTWAKGLADICWKILEKKITGCHHWTDAGVASWYDFAVVIQQLGIKHGLLNREIPIRPIFSHEYPTPAYRPKYTVLNKKSLLDQLDDDCFLHWQKQLDSMLIDYSNSQ